MTKKTNNTKEATKNNSRQQKSNALANLTAKATAELDRQTAEAEKKQKSNSKKQTAEEKKQTADSKTDSKKQKQTAEATAEKKQKQTATTRATIKEELAKIDGIATADGAKERVMITLPDSKKTLVYVQGKKDGVRIYASAKIREATADKIEWEYHKGWAQEYNKLVKLAELQKYIKLVVTAGKKLQKEAEAKKQTADKKTATK